MHVWGSEMDNRAAYSACRGILPLCRGILFVCHGILLDVVTHAAAHQHEVEWFWRQKRDALSTTFSAQLFNWQKSIGKIGILLNDLERNSSGSNEDKQNENVESVLARLYPSGRGQGGERKRLKNVKTHAAADAIFFYQNKENQPRFRLVLCDKGCDNANCKRTATRQTWSIPRQS